MMGAEKVVVLSGAGMSAESGLTTFRDSGGLWENYDIMEVASIDGWHSDYEKVLDFYNKRRKQAAQAKPNAGHYALAELEKEFDVTIITQNVDNLHEKAGSSRVIHLHGELTKARSSANPGDIFDIGDADIKPGDLCREGSQIRPHIVWFGEMVPMMEKAIEITETADYFIVVGTSLVVYPAAGLLGHVSEIAPVFVVDPVKPETIMPQRVRYILEPATTGTPKVVNELLKLKFDNE